MSGNHIPLWQQLSPDMEKRAHGETLLFKLTFGLFDLKLTSAACSALLKIEPNQMPSPFVEMPR